MYPLNPPVMPQYPHAVYEQRKPMRTPFTDMDAEKATMSPEEVAFVAADSDFQKADAEYKTALYQHMETVFRDEFLRVDAQGLAEKKLLAMKMARERYKRNADTVMNDPEVQALIAKKRSEKSGN